MYRRLAVEPEVLLVHPGGPFWRKRDLGSWTIPKGGIHENEQPLDAAIREFTEETGHAPVGPFLELGEIRQKSGKIVHAWAFRGDCDPAQLGSNSFTMEWPARSGKYQTFPEIDQARWFSLPDAEAKMLPAQVALLRRLRERISQMD